jgi:uncharacterized Zn finger protein (UPF0148 family)
MTSFDGDTLLDIPCPNCGQKTQEKVRILEKNRKLQCPSCGDSISIDEEELREVLKLLNPISNESKRNLQS